MMTLPVAGMRVQRELASFEQLIDQSLQQGGLLLAAMMEGRQLDDISPAAGQSALLHLVEAQRALASASSKTIKLHQDLRKLNEDVKAVPDENGECPWPDQFTAATEDHIAA